MYFLIFFHLCFVYIDILLVWFVLLSFALIFSVLFCFFFYFSWKWECEKYQNSRIFAGDCRILEFKPDLKDFSLQGFVIKSFEVQKESDCKARCFQEHNCVSLNIGPSGNNGAYLCELSDSDHEMHSEALKPRDGFTYHSTEVSLTSKIGNNFFPALFCIVNLLNAFDMI